MGIMGSMVILPMIPILPITPNAFYLRPTRAIGAAVRLDAGIGS